jgi:DNA polymerase elongation subunit (family B)
MKKSFADCGKCILCDSNWKICETNFPNNLSNIDEVYIADILEWDILKNYLRDRKVKYLITAPILCSLNGKQNIDLNVILDICKVNALKIIEQCKPKKLITIGPMAKKFESCCPNHNHYELVTELVKPSKGMEEDLLGDLNTLKEVPKQPESIEKSQQLEISGNDNLYMFTIPEKYYTDQYRLIDIQHVHSQSRVIYIFRDKDNNKEYYEAPMKENDFYWYESLSTDNKNIEPYQNLKLMIGNHKNRCITGKGYGGDINITTLHSVDYFLQNKAEAPVVRKNILHFDIEVYTYKTRIFPDPTASMYPIHAISFRMNDNDSHTQMYLLKISKDIDPRIDEIIKSGKYPNVTLFTDEYTMIRSFLTTMRKMDPDFVTGWNSNSFDFPYLVGRMKKLSIQMKDLSPFGNVYADTRGRVIITGMVALDQLELFKNDTTRPSQPSYKLDSIAETVVGRKKVAYEGNLNELYNNDIDTFIRYSINDTELLKAIEDRVQHISLQDELRQITTTGHNGAATTLGQAEGLFLTSMKKKGLIARNKVHTAEKEELPGAYVFEARGGLYEGLLCDFDFTSLYPSIINSWNIGPDTYIGKVSEIEIFDIIYNREKVKEVNITLDPIHNSTTIKMSIDEFNKWIEKNNAQLNISGSIFCGHDKYLSIFSTVISMLFHGRKVYKKKMLDAKEAGDKQNQVNYNGKQMAYKILANALYGALGNEHFKFYHNDLAKSVTLSGQELLKYSTVHLDDYLVKRGKVTDFKINKDFMNKVKSLQDVIYGDTDSAFCYLTDYLKDKKIEVKKSPEVLEEIQRIQDFINKIVLDEFLKYHNINKKDSIIFLKNEYLFSKYYTLNGKKHYAARIISQEGRDVNEIEIKGIEIRRSEIPERSRKLLKEILDVILSDTIKKEDIKSHVDKIVDRSRKEMFDLVDKRDDSIVRTVSYSKPLADYKVIPRHLKAMLIWNILVSEDFRYGSKGKLWDLKAIDINKAPESVKSNFYDKLLKKYNLSDVDCICLPEDVDKLPSYFIPDDKKIIEYGCDDRVNNLIEPLWKESEQRLLW